MFRHRRRQFNGPSSSPLGFLGKDVNIGGSYALTTNWTAAIVNAKLFSGALTNPAKSGGYSNIGFVTVNGDTLSTRSAQAAFMAGVVATPSGSLPVNSTENTLIEFDNQTQALESNLWLTMTEPTESSPSQQVAR
ncbi:hypothetical protein FS837_009650 [Tulasnella sp. UAMH 9824]|nr:hypothetical protein FS837_009650 [Tulasnella sp. UAMH 9824]